jgi:prepilin-type N-terminal cleavage/methylation domain-containing protein
MKLKSGFSMIELILVMVVLGIVSSMSATIIAQVYSSYIVQRAMHDATTKVEIAASIIYNRLSHRVSVTTVGRNINDDSDISVVSDIEDASRYRVVEWYGMASDSFNAGVWSGFCDVDASSSSAIDTPGSNLANLTDIVTNASSSSVDDMAIIFADQLFTSDTAYSPLCMGYVDDSCIAGVRSVAGTTISLDQNYTGLRVAEHYKLVRSAYALVPTSNGEEGKDGSTLFNLELRYDYQPWRSDVAGNAYKTAPSVVLLENVSVFKFSGKGDTIRFKICVDERIGTSSKGDGEYLSICKEKAVIR